VPRTFRIANRLDVVPRLPPIGYELSTLYSNWCRDFPISGEADAGLYALPYNVSVSDGQENRLRLLSVGHPLPTLIVRSQVVEEGSWSLPDFGDLKTVLL